LRRHRELAAREMLAAVVREVHSSAAQEQQDDITLIAASAETDCARTRMRRREQINSFEAKLIRKLQCG